MGKASSAKKVARAARAGGRSSAGRQRNLLFPGVIGGIVLLGSALVWFAADERKGDTDVPPVIGDHWHAAFGIYVCGEWQPDIPEFENTTGVHTHGDGVIHIHPFSQSGAGENATLGTFLEDTDVDLSDDELTIGTNELDEERTWKEGEDQCDDQDAELVVAQWENVQDESSEPAIFTSGLDDIRFRGDGEGYTIAFVPEGETDIPKPQSAANLAELGAVDAGAESGSTTTSTTAAGGATTTTAGQGATTTTAGEGTTTTAGG
jgi:hypothetical protein